MLAVGLVVMAAGAALGVAVLSAVGGRLVTTTGLVDTYRQGSLVVLGVLAALLVIMLTAVPRALTGAQAGPHGHGHHGH